MKIAIALLLACLPLLTCEKAVASDNALCESMSNLAGAIMEGRQAGRDMAEMMKAGSSNDPAIVKLRESFIVAAFEEPRYSSEEYQQKATADFKNSVFLQCFKSQANQ